jgi:hypothetical protein
MSCVILGTALLLDSVLDFDLTRRAIQDSVFRLTAAITWIAISQILWILSFLVASIPADVMETLYREKGVSFS